MRLMRLVRLVRLVKLVGLACKARVTVSDVVSAAGPVSRPDAHGRNTGGSPNFPNIVTQ